MVPGYETADQYHSLYPRGDRKLQEEKILLRIRLVLTPVLPSIILPFIPMTIAENRPIATREKIPFLFKAAVKRVYVTDYMRLRHQYGLCGASEDDQLRKAAAAVNDVLIDDKVQPYSIDDYILKSGFARETVAKMPLSTYLPIRQKVLNGEVNRTTQIRNAYEAMNGYDKEVKRENERLKNLLDDLNVTNRVIAAAKINLSSGRS